MSEPTENARWMRIFFGIVEAAAIVVGLPLTILSLMAVVSNFSPSLWVQLGIALPVALVIPLLIAERMLPDNPAQTQGRSFGIFTDVLAVIWLGASFLFIGVAGSATGPSLHKAAETLANQGVPGVKAVSRFLVPPAGASSQPTDGSKTADSSEADDNADDAASPGSQAEDTKPTKTAEADDGATDDAKTDESNESDDAPKTQKSPAEVFEQAAPSVVSISFRTAVKTPYGKREKKGGGTGFFVDDDIIATNFHVVEKADSAQIQLKDGRKTDDVLLLDADRDNDLALLKVDWDEFEVPDGKDDEDFNDVEALELGDSENVKTGQTVIAIGNPLGLEYTLTDGLISSRRVWRGRKMLQVSVPLSPGNSGGPLLDLKGQVLGVSTAKLGNAWNNGENLNLAVPANTLEELIDSDHPEPRPLDESHSNTGTW